MTTPHPADDDAVCMDVPANMCLAIASALNALTYITQPAIWPQFVAWHGGIAGDPEAARTDIRSAHIIHLMESHSDQHLAFSDN